jgi:hypothetical protein
MPEMETDHCARSWRLRGDENWPGADKSTHCDAVPHTCHTEWHETVENGHLR